MNINCNNKYPVGGHLGSAARGHRRATFYFPFKQMVT